MLSTKRVIYLAIAARELQEQGFLSEATRTKLAALGVTAAALESFLAAIKD